MPEEQLRGSASIQSQSRFPIVHWCAWTHTDRRTVSVGFLRLKSTIATHSPELFVVALPRLGIHRDGRVNRISGRLNIPRVHDHTAVQTLCGTGELRQDHDTVLVDLTRDVFVSDLWKADDGSALYLSQIEGSLTKFIPSRVLVTRQASDRAYMAVSSSRGTLVCIK